MGIKQRHNKSRGRRNKHKSKIRVIYPKRGQRRDGISPGKLVIAAEVVK